MALIKNHDKSGIANAYVNIRQINARKDVMQVVMDVYASKDARNAGKAPIDVVEVSGPHNLTGEGNLWEKGYAVARTHDELKNAVDDL